MGVIPANCKTLGTPLPVWGKENYISPLLHQSSVRANPAAELWTFERSHYQSGMRIIPASCKTPVVLLHMQTVIHAMMSSRQRKRKEEGTDPAVDL